MTEEKNNLSVWRKVCQPPKEVLSKIKAGRIKGMTDIKPIWRIKIMTELFGVCGIGWKYSISKRWLEAGSENQSVAFVDVEVFIKDNGEWSDAIPGNGGSVFVAKEKSGMHTSTEAYKMATTDALSSAFKMLGVAGDIYMGAFDGSKYNEPYKPKKVYMTKEQSNSFIEFCTKEKLDPTEVAVQYAVTKKMDTTSFDNVFKQIKAAVDSGELGYRFSVPEGEEDSEELL